MGRITSVNKLVVEKNGKGINGLVVTDMSTLESILVVAVLSCGLSLIAETFYGVTRALYILLITWEQAKDANPAEKVQYHRSRSSVYLGSGRIPQSVVISLKRDASLSMVMKNIALLRTV